MTDTNFKVNLNDLKNIFTARSSTDSKLSYNTGFTVNGQDLTELFLPFTVGPAAANTGYIVQSQGKDLSEIFQNINDPLGPYTISDKSNIEVTTIKDNGYTGLIFENTSSLGSTGTCNIVINFSTINILVVGGGGGGACGNFSQSNTCGGCGGGGSGIIYHENLSITSGNTFKISVGAGGTGRKVSNGGNGGSAGSSGIASSFTDNVVNLSTIQTTYTSGGSTIVQGNNGWGSGTTFGYGGGVGGSVNNNASGAQGGGGGGGGGAADSSVFTGEPPAKVQLASPYLGYLNNTGTNSGKKGSNGSIKQSGSFFNPTTEYVGGDGGESYYGGDGLTVPFTAAKIYCGNGGGGGSAVADSNFEQNPLNGGSAGGSTGGKGGASSNKNGENATYGFDNGNYYYGNGGGGGAMVNDSTNYGGNGGYGVIMIWFASS